MAKVTIVPHGRDDIEIGCGDQIIRVRFPAAADEPGSGNEPGKADQDKDADPGKGSDDEKKSKGKEDLPPFSPYIPLFVQPKIGAASHFSYVNVGPTEETQSFREKVDAAWRGVGDRHLVVFLAKPKVDLHELGHIFSDLPADMEVTVVLTRDDA